MGEKTRIEWTRDDDGRPGSSWNSINGCRRASPGCKNCYAEANAGRFCKPGMPYHGLVKIMRDGPRWTGDISFALKHLLDPIRWRRPRRIFVNSTSDTFLDAVPDWYLDKLFAVMALSPRHTFQILTKRPARLMQYLTTPHATLDGTWDAREAITREAHLILAESKDGHAGGRDSGGVHSPVHVPVWPLPNVHLGFSAENQECFDRRWQPMETLARQGWFVWCSAEPLLGPIDIGAVVRNGDVPLLRWLVAGGESGRAPQKPRPTHPDWVRALRDQCRELDVRFWFKQWGSFLPGKVVQHGPSLSLPDARTGIRFASQGEAESPVDIASFNSAAISLGGEYLAFPVRKSVAGNRLDGETWEQFPTTLA